MWPSVLSLAALVCVRAQLDAFLPPSAASATGGELGPATVVSGAPACAAACVADASCASFTLRTQLPTVTCGVRPECYVRALRTRRADAERRERAVPP